jgi:hypothetical protein
MSVPGFQRVYGTNGGCFFLSFGGKVPPRHTLLCQTTRSVYKNTRFARTRLRLMEKLYHTKKTMFTFNLVRCLSFPSTMR